MQRIQFSNAQPDTLVHLLSTLNVSSIDLKLGERTFECLKGAMRVKFIRGSSQFSDKITEIGNLHSENRYEGIAFNIKGENDFHGNGKGFFIWEFASSLESEFKFSIICYCSFADSFVINIESKKGMRNETKFFQDLLGKIFNNDFSSKDPRKKLSLGNYHDSEVTWYFPDTLGSMAI